MRDSSGELWLGHGDETGGTQMAHQRTSSCLPGWLEDEDTNILLMSVITK